MDLSTVIKAVLAPHTDRAEPSFSGLKPGDQLTGKVLKVEGEGRVLIDLGGRRASAHIGFPVKVGHALKLRVVDSGSILHLKVDTPQKDSQADLSLSKANFSQALAAKDQTQFLQTSEKLLAGVQRFGKIDVIPKTILNALTQIRSVFQPVPMDQSPQAITKWLKAAVEDRGIFFEKQMADFAADSNRFQNQGGEAKIKNQSPRILITRDIKPQLIQLRNFLLQATDQDLVFEKINSKEITFLRQSVDRMLGHIEHQQDRAVSRWGEGENQQVIVHTLPLPDQAKPIQLKVYYPRKDTSTPDGGQHRIALLLNLDPMGNVRVDLAMVDRQLQVGFFVEDPTIERMISQQVKNVETSLQDHFEKVMISVSVSKERIAKFDKEDIAGVDAGRINISV